DRAGPGGAGGRTAGRRARRPPGELLHRRLVFAAHRDGGQRQFVERSVPAVPDTSLAPVLAWARRRLDRPLTVADLAGRAAVSQATLHRRTGLTPTACRGRFRLTP
ncbi:hypothetical protein ACWDUI_22830, partial [Streptosporangium sandarakinum]